MPVTLEELKKDYDKLKESFFKFRQSSIESHMEFKQEFDEKQEAQEENFKKLFKKTNYEAQPFFRMQQDFIKSTSQNVEEFKTKFGKLDDLIQIKDKY